MVRNNFFPLRSVVGSSVPIQKMLLLEKKPDDYPIVLHEQLTTTVDQKWYKRFLPTIGAGTVASRRAFVI